MAFQDQTLTCRDCGNPFVWTSSEQEFYQSKGFQNSPVRCPSCRQAKKDRMEGGRGGGGGDRGQRQMYEITCSNCGKKDMVPFQPRGDRPVLCGDCFRNQRDGGGSSKGDQRDQQPEPQPEAQPEPEAEAEVKPEEPKE